MQLFDNKVATVTHTHTHKPLQLDQWLSKEKKRLVERERETEKIEQKREDQKGPVCFKVVAMPGLYYIHFDARTNWTIPKDTASGRRRIRRREKIKIH